MNDKEYQKYIEQRLKKAFIINNDIRDDQLSNNEGDEDEKDDTLKNTSELEQRRSSMQQWNTEEKALFIELLKKHGRDWTAIADALPHKTDK